MALTAAGCSRIDELRGEDTPEIPTEFDLTGRTFTIGAKRTAENELLAQMLVAVFEDRGALIAISVLDDPRSALLDGAIDVYPEYDGTAWQVHNDRDGDLPDLDTLRGVDAGIGITWTDVADFSNSYTLVTAPDAEGSAPSAGDLTTLLTTGAGNVCHDAVFAADPAGLAAMQAALPDVPAAAYVERNSGEVIAGAADRSCLVGQVLATDSRLAGFDVARTDLVTFDRYRPGYSWRTVQLGSDPDALLAVAETVLDTVDVDTMTALNAQVELEGRSAAEVARAHLTTVGLLGG